MKVNYNGKAYGGTEFNSNDIGSLESLVKNGYNFYVTNDTQTSGTDPWSGMPNNKLEYWAFKDRSDADNFAKVATGNIFNPDSKSSVNRLDDLLSDRQLYAKNAEERRAKDAAAAEKRREYHANLPQWKKVRTQAVRAKNEFEKIKSEYERLKSEYNASLDKLKQAMDAEGIEYSDIESVLSKEFLKK